MKTDKPEFGHKLRLLREEKGLTQKELAKKVGVSEVTAGNWERGVKKPGMEALAAIAEALSCSLDALLEIRGCGGADSLWGSLTKRERALLREYRGLDTHGKKAVETLCSLERERVEAERTAEQEEERAERWIPLYWTPAAAGFSAPLDGVDFEMMQAEEGVPRQADFAVKIQGDSMNPYIEDGEIVYVQKEAEILAGDIGIFCVDGAMYCKKYSLDEEKNLVLLSTNPERQDANVFVSAESKSFVKCFGKVLLRGTPHG